MARFASVAGGALAEAGFSLDGVKAKALELGAEAQDTVINLAELWYRQKRTCSFFPIPHDMALQHYLPSIVRVGKIVVFGELMGCTTSR